MCLTSVVNMKCLNYFHSSNSPRSSWDMEFAHSWQLHQFQVQEMTYCCCQCEPLVLKSLAFLWVIALGNAGVKIGVSQNVTAYDNHVIFNETSLSVCYLSNAGLAIRMVLPYIDILCLTYKNRNNDATNLKDCIWFECWNISSLFTTLNWLLS